MRAAHSSRIVRLALYSLALLCFTGASGVVRASCSLPRQFISSEIWLEPRPNYYPNGPEAFFWALGSGMPAIGSGIDSGAVDICAWGYDYYLYNCFEENTILTMRGDWAYPGVDGCIDAAGATPYLDGDECMAMAVSETTSDSWAAVMTERASPGANPDPSVLFDFSRPAHPNDPSAIPTMSLGMIPTPTITSIIPSGSQAIVTARVSQGLFSGRGQYLEPACGNALAGFELYKTATSSSGSVPSAQWKKGARWSRVATAGPLGSEMTFTLDCIAGTETVLSTAYSLRDGFSTVHLSRPTAPIGTLRDADQDAVPDACDSCTDTDGDGRGDPGFLANTCAPDSCPAVSDPAGADADGDGRGDACDRCPGRGDPDPLPLHTDNNSREFLGRFDAAGAAGRVIFLAARNSSAFELFSIGPGDPVPLRLSGTLVAGGEVFEFTLSPAGDMVAYWADQDTDDNIELFVVPVAGGQPLRLGGRFNSRPADTGTVVLQFSPDGRLIVYQADQDQPGELNFYSVPVDGSRPPARLNIAQRAGYVMHITPDSSRVVFQTYSGNIYGAPINGGNEVLLGWTRILPNQAVTPDSSLFLYIADATVRGHDDLIAVPVTGGAPRRVNPPLQPAGDVALFDLAPDGNRVVYRADQDTDGVFEVYSVTLSGSAVKLNVPIITGGKWPGSGMKAAISPDSRTVVYALDQDTPGLLELYAVPIDGGTPLKLSGPMVAGGGVTFGGPYGFSKSFDITPDGKTLIYLAEQITDNQRELFRVSITGGAANRLNLPLPQFQQVNGFQIAADGETVLFNAGSPLGSPGAPENLFAAGLTQSGVFQVSQTSQERGPHHQFQSYPQVEEIQQPIADGSAVVFRTGLGLFEAPLECFQPPVPLQLYMSVTPSSITRQLSTGMIKVFVQLPENEPIDLASLRVSVDGSDPLAPAQAIVPGREGASIILQYPVLQVLSQSERCGAVPLELSGTTTAGQAVQAMTMVQVACPDQRPFSPTAPLGITPTARPLVDL